MQTTITDNGASIKLTIGTQVRNIIKSQIVEIAVIKTNIIKIDIRLGALYNIYIPYADVTNPVTANAEALRDAINAFIPTSSGGANPSSGATEAKQNQQIEVLTDMKTHLLTVKDLLVGTEYKPFEEPLLVDDSGVGVVYKGFASLATPSSDGGWAIQRIERKGEVNITTWASGNKKFVNRWVDRETLNYL